MRSGLSLVLIPIPGKNQSSTRIFDQKGHFPDQSTVIKHRLSDVSANQINIVRSGITSSSMRNIDEEPDNFAALPGGAPSLTSDASLNLKKQFQKTVNAHNQSIKQSVDINSPHKLSKSAQRQSQDWANLRNWTESFVLKKAGKAMTSADLMRRDNVEVICEGCQTKICYNKFKDKDRTLPTYKAGEGSNKKTFLFCDVYCETLRKYKEAIRQYAFEYEFTQLYQTLPCDVTQPDRRIHLFAMKDTLLVVDSALSRNANVEDKKPYQPKKEKEHKLYPLHSRV